MEPILQLLMNKIILCGLGGVIGYFIMRGVKNKEVEQLKKEVGEQNVVEKKNKEWFDFTKEYVDKSTGTVKEHVNTSIAAVKDHVDNSTAIVKETITGKIQVIDLKLNALSETVYELEERVEGLEGVEGDKKGKIYLLNKGVQK